MDDNTLKIVEKAIELQAELGELKNMKRALIELLWNAELNEAYECEKYDYKRHNKIEQTQIRVSDVRAVLGLMPNPEAVAIYKSIKEADANVRST